MIATTKQIRKILVVGLILCLLGVKAYAQEERPILKLDNSCTVTILNRAVQATVDGDFTMPSVPSFMGRVRARAICFNEDGSTTTGQTDYFSVVENSTTDIGNFYVETVRVPTSISYVNGQSIELTSIGETVTLELEATYSDGALSAINNQTDGVNFTSTDNSVVTVSTDGVVRSITSGSALIVARKDGVIALITINVVTSGDSDGDGIPDDIELANGLNPNDGVDGYEDLDKDGISSRDEYLIYNTQLNNTDTDGDTLLDGEEVSVGDDGFITDPLKIDTDNDGIGYKKHKPPILKTPASLYQLPT